MYAVVTIETGDLEAPPKAGHIIISKNGTRTGESWDLRDGGDAIVDKLYELAMASIPIVTFNGTGFGFKQLCGVTANRDRVETLALLTRDVSISLWNGIMKKNV